MSVYEMAQKYYPKYWDKLRLQSLMLAGKLTGDEYIELVGEEAGVS